MTDAPWFTPVPYLHTERLRLRPITRKDAPAVFALFADPDVTRYQDVDTFQCLEEAEAWIAARNQAYQRGQAIKWGLARRQDDLLVGACGLSGWDRDAAQAEVGYELTRAYWGQGLMPETLGAVARFGFDAMRLRRITARVMVDNTASQHVLTKLGFQDEGVTAKPGCWKGATHDLRLFALYNNAVNSKCIVSVSAAQSDINV